MADLWEALKSKLDERLNWGTFKKEIGQGFDTMPQAGLVLDTSSMFPKFLRLAKELPFEERAAITKAIPDFVKQVSGNKAYDFSGDEAIELLKRLAKIPQRFGSKTTLLDRAKTGVGEMQKNMTLGAGGQVLPVSEYTRAASMIPNLYPAERALKFGGRTGAANMYAGLVGELQRSGFMNPYQEIKKILELAGYAGIK